MPICVGSYAEQSEMQSLGHLRPKKKKIENVKPFLHLVSCLVGKISQPRNLMLVRTERVDVM